ncbi:hypothetical protein BC830DRAFT_1157523 [Chytriomyces sp. MP71]|nr:hypothetical protein BC830DRAFT_1157523 [Chytriomyces sp. MP71]
MDSEAPAAAREPGEECAGAAGSELLLLDVVQLLRCLDTSDARFATGDFDGIKDKIDDEARPASLGEIEDRLVAGEYRGQYPLLMDDVEMLLHSAVAVTRGKKDVEDSVREAANEMSKVLRLAQEELGFDDANEPQKYLVKDGDHFEDQKVSLTRRNQDGSLLFTNAYAGPLPEDFYRVSELDDNLTPVYIHPTLSLPPTQVPTLAQSASLPPVKVYKRKREDLHISHAVEFLDYRPMGYTPNPDPLVYNPYQTFAPVHDASLSLIGAKETAALWSCRRRKQVAGKRRIVKQASVAEEEEELLRADGTGVDVALKKLTKEIEAGVDKGLANSSEEVVKLAERIEQALVKKMLLAGDQVASKDISASKADVMASLVASSLEPVFKGMLHQRGMK